MSKGIAINTILYLLLGILVVGIVVYLVYTYSGRGQLTQQQCRSKIISWCTGCSVANWATGTGALAASTATDDKRQVELCIEKYFDNSKDYASADCNKTNGGTAGEIQTLCKSFV